MKKLIVLFLLCLAPVCFAGSTNHVNIAFVAAGGLTCTTANDSIQFEPTTQPGTSGTGAIWVADKFVLSAQTTITAYNARQCKTAESVSGTVELEIFNHDAGNDQPDETSVVSNSSVSMLSNDMLWCDSGDQVDDFALASPIVLSAGTYWIVNKVIGSTARTQKFVSSTGDRAASSADSGSTWSTFANTAYDMEVWGCVD